MANDIKTAQEVFKNKIEELNINEGWSLFHFTHLFGITSQTNKTQEIKNNIINSFNNMETDLFRR